MVTAQGTAGIARGVRLGVAGLGAARGVRLGVAGLGVLAAAALVLALLGPPASATHEQLEARGITEACPPDRVAESGFEDVAGNAHEDAVDCVAWWGVTQGRSATAYDPSASVRRDQMASFIYRKLVAAGVDVPLEPRQAFEDVDSNNPHARAVNALAELGVVSGFDDDTYRPGRQVRRDQMASFLSRSAEHTLGQALTDDHQWFDDVGEGNPHAAAVNGLADAGVVQGREEGVYAPGLGTRRDQMASFVSRSLDVLVAEGTVAPPRGAQADLAGTEGEDLGAVTLTERIDGQVDIEASVEGLPEGFHGFHLHQTGSCEPDFSAAGGHHNPDGASHGDHAGDLPVVPVRADGAGDLAFVTDRVTVDELLADDGTAIIIHEGPDNYANIPERYGGPDEDTRATGDAGGRLACGVVEETPVEAPSEAPTPPGAREPGPEEGTIGTFWRSALVNAEGEDVGEVAVMPQQTGPTEVEAVLTDLPPSGFHGFHIHESGSCEPDFSAAGGHHNPDGAGHGDHAGDLPVALGAERGTAWLSFRTDRVAANDLLTAERSVIVHENPDNYANVPDRYGGPDEETLAGGDSGGRRACGVLQGVVLDQLEAASRP